MVEHSMWASRPSAAASGASVRPPCPAIYRTSLSATGCVAAARASVERALGPLSSVSRAGCCGRNPCGGASLSTIGLSACTKTRGSKAQPAPMCEPHCVALKLRCLGAREEQREPSGPGDARRRKTSESDQRLKGPPRSRSAVPDPALLRGQHRYSERSTKCRPRTTARGGWYRGRTHSGQSVSRRGVACPSCSSC